MSTHLKIGTRGSDLALIQANMVKDALLSHFPDIKIEIVEILTSGDWAPEQGETRLKEEHGGKGQFAKEIEAALLNETIDLAVHSMKDMETTLPDGLVIKHMLPREDPRDALLVHAMANFDGTIASFADGTVFGTASVRRQAFLLAENDNLNIVPFRGNVPTRIEKLKAGQVQATLLAYAGLKRMGLEHEAYRVLDTETMLPAAGQGAVGIEIRETDETLSGMLDKVNCQTTLLCVYAERAALNVLDGSCHTPIGAHATLNGESLYLRVRLASLNGKQIYNAEEIASVQSLDEAIALGQKVGQAIKDKAPAALLKQNINE